MGYTAIVRQSDFKLAFWAKYPRHGKPWWPDEIDELIARFSSGAALHDLVLWSGRRPSDVSQLLHKLGCSEDIYDDGCG